MAKQKQQEESTNTGLRALVFLMLALIAGGAATVTVYQLIESYKRQIAEAQKPEETKLVIIAAADLFTGVTITEQDIVGVQVPVKYLPSMEGVPDYFTSHELVVGRVPRERILANEYIRPGRLADGEQGIGLNALIEKGMRALSINIANGRAVSGFLNPGNKVDILVTLKDDEASGEEAKERQTLTLLQAVPVLAVNTRMVQDEPVESDKDKKKKKKKTKEGKPSVTLLVTPEQAEQVAHAERIGTITLALRNQEDGDFVDENGSIVTEDLLGKKEEPKDEKKPVKKKPKPVVEQPTLEIIRGGKKTEQGVNPDGSIKLK
jgi:pilus assembly protein CpaB